VGFPLSVFVAEAPLNWKSHIDGLYAAETCFLQFKEPVPFKFKNKISAVQCKKKTFLLI
jgi:hypothetical protein